MRSVLSLTQSTLERDVLAVPRMPCEHAVVKGVVSRNLTPRNCILKRRQVSTH